MNLGQAAEQLITRMGFANTGIPRIWCHDVIHVISGATGLDATRDFPYFTDEAEIISTIYQAVLLREKDVFVTRKSYRYEVETQIRDGENPPSLMDIINLIPKVMNLPFINRPDYMPLSNSEIYTHFVTAIRLSSEIFEHFGKHLGEMTQEEISDQPLVLFEEMLGRAKEDSPVMSPVISAAIAAQQGSGLIIGA